MRIPVLLALLGGAAAAAAAPLPPDVPTGADGARDAALAKQARPLLEAHSDYGARFLRDGRGLVFMSDRDGLPQIYVADGRPDAPARRLVDTGERVTNPLPLPDGRTLLFRGDHGADENWSIFRVDLDGKNLKELTPGDKLNRDELHLAEGAPDSVYYTARSMAAAASTLWALPLDGRPARKVYSDDKGIYLSDVSKDGKWALVGRSISRTDNQLLEIDLASGAARVLYPTSGVAEINDAVFSPDGTRVFVTTDGGGEQALVLALDRGSKKELARYVETQPTTAALRRLAMSPAGDRLVVEVSAGERSELRILHAATLASAARVAAPLGIGSLGRFSADGKRVTIGWSTPTTPWDVLAVDAHSGAVTPLRHEARPSLPKLPPVDVSVVILHGRDGSPIPTNVYRPLAAGRHPVIVSYHGGPAGASGLYWDSMAAFFLLQGYAWVAPNVRGSSGFGRAFEMADNGKKRVAALEDVDASAEWVAAQPWVDPQRMVVLGGSYGGYTVLMSLIRKPALWRAGVDMFGPVDWHTVLKVTSGSIREIFRVEVGELGKDDAFLTEISPITRIDGIQRALFVYAGANDPRVPRSESDQVVTAVRKHGVPCEYMVKDDEGHSLSHRPNQIELYARVARFLEKALRAPASSK